MPSKIPRLSAIKTCPRCHAETRNGARCPICQFSFGLDKSQTQNPKMFSPPTLAQNGQKILQRSKNCLSVVKRDIQNPSAWLGLAALTFSIVLWGNYFWSLDKTETKLVDLPKLRSYKTIERVEHVPEGLFSYGGSAYFAPLMAQGLNDAIALAHPEFHLRYSQTPTFQTSYSSNSEGIKRLINGEISFAYSDRPLTPEEYAAAQGRGISLKQVPIALDGVVVFTNNRIGVSAIRLDKVREIFAGRITNWNQLGGINLPIVPVLLSDEELEVLEVDRAANNTQYAPNQTLVMRKVIATPGAVALASASIVANQKLIEPLDLAHPHSTNFVRPFIEERQPNLEAFSNGSYPLTRRQFLIIREDDTPDELAGYAQANILISKEGQKYVEQAGSVPIY